MVCEGDVVVCWFWAALVCVAGFLAVAGFVVEATGAIITFVRRGACLGGFVFPD